ncbi:Ribonuclease H1 [Harpegnathos saltator]|uniref:ribonuclease H n=1 Tax=Harpegnathos saltator TaxID=610380 RepID=E2B4I9_HARSA|nr:Ribonuclease H1 [Harpegnathos saltator]
MPYYAVARGRKPGIYATWDECKSQVNKFLGARYKKFSTENEAQNFIKEHSFLATQINSTEAESAKSIEEGINKVDFITDKDGYVNVFTDGACSSNGYKNARAGIGVWFQDHHPLNVSQPVEGRPTNNMAEIQAVTVAARQAKKAGIKKLRINTDSKFLILCITEWMSKWKSRGWLTVGNKPVINKVELLEMEKELEPLIVAWNHVNGHAGIHGNEMADKLAREGCMQYKSQNKQG